LNFPSKQQMQQSRSNMGQAADHLPTHAGTRTYDGPLPAKRCLR